jgi:hypothetical protein
MGSTIQSRDTAGPRIAVFLTRWASEGSNVLRNFHVWVHLCPTTKIQVGSVDVDRRYNGRRVNCGLWFPHMQMLQHADAAAVDKEGLQEEGVGSGLEA